MIFGFGLAAFSVIAVYALYEIKKRLREYMYDYSYLYIGILIIVSIIAAAIYYFLVRYNRAKKRIHNLSIEQQNELIQFENDRKTMSSDNLFKGTALSKMDLFD